MFVSDDHDDNDLTMRGYADEIGQYDKLHVIVIMIMSMITHVGDDDNRDDEHP